MMTQLIEVLNQHPDVAQWSVLHRVRREWQHYLMQEKPEATREVTHEAYEVTVYHQHPHSDGSGRAAMGSTTVTLTAADAGQIAARIEEGLLAASLTNNEPWSLPKPSSYPDVPLADEDSLLNPQEEINAAAERLLAAVRKEEQVRLSAAEFFFEETTSVLQNSEGVYGEHHGTLFTLEFVLLANNGKDPETEHYVMEKRRRIADLNIEDVIADNAAFARDSLVAELPKTWKGAVVIEGEALPELLMPIRFHALGSSKHAKISQMNAGEQFFGDREVLGEPFNVTYSSTLPYGVHSTRFHYEGVPGQDVRVVEDNVFMTFLSSQRYADYLGVEATGENGNLVLQPGEMSHDKLLQGPVFYIVAFSAMMPNPFTGNFAAEIKLGYYIDQEGNRTPVKGGSLSGNLFDGLADVFYAKEVVFTGAYQGPKSVRFNELTIAGE